MKDFAILAAFLLLSGCIIVEVLDCTEPEPELTPIPMKQMQKDTTARDTTETKDTIRIPIGFEVGVDGWEEEYVEI